MRLAGRLAFGFMVTIVVLACIVVILALIAVPAYGIEILAQKYIYPPDPSYVYPHSDEEGAAFAISYVAILIGVLGAMAYAYDTRDD